MKLELIILPRILTVEFYRVNTAFFLMVLGVAAGFMRTPEHLALAGFFVSSPWAMTIPILVWTFYTFKIILFNRAELAVPRNHFVHHVALLGSFRKWRTYATVAFGQMAPALAYGIFVGSVGIAADQYLTPAIACVALVVMTSLVALTIARTLERPIPEHVLNTLSLWLDQHLAKPLVWIFTTGTLQLQPGLFYATKLFTALLVFGTSRLYLFDDYDGRLYAMGGCFAFGANLTLVFQYQRFELIKFPLLRSLPIGSVRRITTFVLSMAILCFPEIAMLATYLPSQLTWHHYLLLITFGFSLVILGFGSLYQRPMSFDTFTRWVFFVTMGCFLSILFKLPIWVLTVACTTVGIYWLATRYYGFEPVPEEF